MPGRVLQIASEEDEPKYSMSKHDSMYRGTYGMPEHTSRRVAGGESYTVPYPFRTVTTGYGLCEPQWSEGPPPLIHHLSPYAAIPLPPMYPINVILAANSKMMRWMIHERAELAVAAPVYGQGWQAMPATEPSSNGPMSIRIEPLRTMIVVPPTTRGVLTVGDVLFAIYHGVRSEVQKARYGSSPSSNPSRRHGMSTAQGGDQISMDVQSSMRSCTQWVGLAPSRTEPDVWVLHTTPAIG